MTCALCSNDKFENISNVDAKSSEDLLVSICNKCGLIQQTPIPTADELKIYYSHNYRKDYKKTFTPKPKHIYRAGKIAIQRINFLNDVNISNGALLDVGAGGGEFVYLAGKLGFQSQGIEPSIGYSEYANSEYGCNIITGDLDEINGSYDIITMFHVMEHLSSPIRAFEKLHGLMSKKGKLFVEVPWIETNDASPSNIYFKAHIFYFSVDTLVSCASQFFYVKKIDTSSSLKILFEVKTELSSIELPSVASVERVRNRLASKGWGEYLFKGNGLIKPIKKIARAIDESRVNNIAPRKILDGFAEEQ